MIFIFRSKKFCDTIKLLLQAKQAGNNYYIIFGEDFAIVDKIIEYKSISTKQHSTLVDIVLQNNVTVFFIGSLPLNEGYKVNRKITNCDYMFFIIRTMYKKYC